MGADALDQMKEWLNDEIENRMLFIATLKDGSGDAGMLADKEAALSLFKNALAAAAKSVGDLDAFLAGNAANPRSAAMAKMWQGLKGA